ncbi:MAG: beta-ketoacyl synthase N-terminal-like domain-containing protein [Acidobacteriota bacterium]
MSAAEVVITAAGAIHPLGDSPQALHEAACAGRSGLAAITDFPTAGLPRDTAFPLQDYSPREHLGRGNLRALDRTSRLAATACQKALDAGGWEAGEGRKEVGLVLGTMFGSIRTISEFDRRCLEAGPQYVKPLDFANSVINAAAGQAAIWHGLPGINATLTGGPTAGLQAIGYGTDLIRRERAALALAGGAEELSFEALFGFARSGHLSDDPAGPRPFDEGRSGFVLGEGAALVMLEDAERAAERGAPTLATVLGQGNAFDPTRGRDEDSAVAAVARSIELALQEAELPAAAIDAVSAGASGLRLGDEREGLGLARALNGGARKVPVAAVKSQLGETLGASGALQTLLALEILRTGRVPGVHRLEKVPKSLETSGLDLSPDAQTTTVDRVLVTAAGLDGNHFALILGKVSS